MNVRNVEWVVKISKLCNLRCTYCYEFPFLGNPERMSLHDLFRMFQHIADYYSDNPKRMDFVWHGGEPLLRLPHLGLSNHYLTLLRTLVLPAKITKSLLN